jgi:hypothetical protein
LDENLLVLPPKLVERCFLFIWSLERLHGKPLGFDVLKNLRADEHGQCLGEIYGTKFPVYLFRFTSRVYLITRISHIVILIAACFLGWKALLALLVTGALELIIPKVLNRQTIIMAAHVLAFEMMSQNVLGWGDAFPQVYADTVATAQACGQSTFWLDSLFKDWRGLSPEKDEFLCPDSKP